ncbi:MAG: type I 3-dehydroquinate dehydratase [Syntrophobacteraceae bacterium]
MKSFSGFPKAALNSGQAAPEGVSRAFSGICGCLGQCSLELFPKWLNHPGVDLLEWRIDRFSKRYSPGEIKAFCEALSAGPRRPVIATNRPVRQMGDFEGPEDLRLGLLEEAAKAGAEWVDLEYDSDPADIKRFKKTGARVLLSWHDPQATPSETILRERLEKMAKAGPDALKIATFARVPEDNLRVLNLICLAKKEWGLDLVCFCMGPVGKWSRVASLFMGSPWTYAQMDGQEATAPGQFDAAGLRLLIRALS